MSFPPACTDAGVKIGRRERFASDARRQDDQTRRGEEDREVLGGTVSREDGRLVVRTSLSRTLPAALASALFVAMGAYLCAGSLLPSLFANPFVSPSSRIFVFVAGAATTLFFGFTLAFFLSRLFSLRRTIFEVSSEGILDRSSALSAGFVPWEKVEGAATVLGATLPRGKRE